MKSLFSIRRLQKIWSENNNNVISDFSNSLSWDSFIKSVENLTHRLSASSNASWLLYTEEPGAFVIAFLSLLYAGKNIHLPGVQPESDLSSEGFPVLSDIKGISRLGIGIDNSIKTKSINCYDYNSGQKIIFHTSGSTGKPKQVVKNIIQIENELDSLMKLWGELFQGSTVYTTVSHQHFYGILFSVLFPLVRGAAIASKRLNYPEALYSLDDKKQILISSPAFLKRLRNLENPLSNRKHKLSVFSSGGFLPAKVADFCSPFFNTKIIEVYGSTETGGIAWRTSPGNSFWTPFDVVSVLTEEEGMLRIKSPYLENNEEYILEDHIRVMENGKIELCGRKDSIVKVEEKRVALNDIENRIMETGFVTDAAVFIIEEKRQFIAAAIELNKKGKLSFNNSSKKDINKYFRQYLSVFFHPTVLPKKWRYPCKMPVNAQGKIQRNEVLLMFKKNLCDNPEILSEKEIDEGWLFEINYPENYRYFDGHFPEMKILPAVAQVDWVLNIIKSKTGKSLSVSRIPRLKFKNPIFPDKKIDVKIIYKQELSKVTFEYAQREVKKLFSSGNIYLKENSK